MLNKHYINNIMKKEEYKSPNVEMFDAWLNGNLLSASNPDAVFEDFTDDGSFNM